MCLPVIIKRNEMREEYIGQLSAAINRPAILYENQGDQSFEGDQEMGLRRGLKWGGPQYSIVGTCIWANKSNPVNIRP